MMMMMTHGTPSSVVVDDVTANTIIQGLKSKDVETELRVVGAARDMLHGAGQPHTLMMQAGIIPPLVEALDRDDCPSLQYQAIDVLIKLAFGSFEHTLAVVYSGVIPKLISFLAREGDLAELAIVTLGSLALHGAEARDSVLTHGAVQAMLPHMRPDTPVKLLRTFVRTYSILCSYNTMNLELLSPALHYIYELLHIKDDGSEDLTEHGLSMPCRPALWEDEDGQSLRSKSQQQHKIHAASDIVEDACTALANIMHCGDECIEVVQAVPGLTSRLVTLLQHEVTKVKEAALSAIGNMLSGTDAQIDRCLEANCLEHIVSLLQSSNTSLVQEAARATSNILSGTHSQIQQALDKDILTPLRGVLANGNPEGRKQARYVVTYLCINGSAAQRAQLVSRGVLEPYCALLATPDRTLAGEVLDSLDVLLQDAETEGNVKPLCYMLDEFDVLDQIQTLRENTIDEDRHCKISNMSLKLRKHAREERSIVHDKEVFTSEMIVQGLQSLHQATQTRAARAAYYMLREQHPPIHALLEAGIMAPLVAGLDRDACADFQYAAAWILHKMTAGTRKHKMAVVNSGAISKLLAFLVLGEKVVKLAGCSLANMVAHSPETRDAVRACTRDQAALEELKTYVRGYRKWCSQVHDKSKDELKPELRALPFLLELLDIGNIEIIKDICAALADLMHDSKERIAAVQAVPGLTARLVSLLGHEALDVQEIALKAVKNILSGTHTQADRCLKAGCLDHLISLLQGSEPSLVEAAAAATYEMFCHPSTIQRALDKDILTLLRKILSSKEAECRKQAAYATTSFGIMCTAAQRAQLVSSGVLEPYCALLATPDRELTEWVLDGLYIFLQKAKKGNTMKLLCLKLEQIGVIELSETLQEQEIDDELRVKAAQLSVVLRRKVQGEYRIIEDGKVFTLTEIVKELQSQDLATQKRAARAAWSLLSLDDPPRTAMIQAGVVAPLVAALGRDDCSDLQYVATCALNCITAGSHKHSVAIVNSGAIPKLVALLALGGEPALPAAWILGNIAIKAPVSRDLVLSRGAVGALLPHMKADTPLVLLKKCLEAYRNFCAHIVLTSTVELIKPGLPFIFELLDNEDHDVLKFACMALSNLMHCMEECIDAVQAVPGLTARLIALLEHEDTEVQVEALKAVGNMLDGADTQVDFCLDAGCLDHILSLLQCSEPALVEDAARATNNILAKADSRIQLALDEDIVTPLLNILAEAEPNSYMQCHAIYALANLTVRGTHEHRLAAVHGGAIPKLVAILSCGVAVAEPAAGALGNIAEDGPETRDLVLALGAVRGLLPHMWPDTPEGMLRTSVEAYGKFCRHHDDKPLEKLELVSPALPYISNLLEIDDENCLEQICLALTELAKTSDGIDVMQVVPGLTARLVALLQHEATDVKRTAFVAVMHMLSGTDSQVDYCLDADCVEHVISFLRCRDRALMQEAAEATRAALGTTHLKIQRALDKGVLTPLMTILVFHPDDQKQKIRAITNLCRRATAAQRAQLVSRGVLEPYCALLATPDRTLAGEVLDSLDVLLQVAVDDGNLEPFSLKLVEIGILDQMKLLRENEDIQVREKVCCLMEKYFLEE